MKRPDEKAMGIPPVIHYVNLVLYDAITRGQSTLLFTRSVPLPAPPDPRGDPTKPPEFGPFVNRLKVMSGLDPVKNQDPLERKFKLIVAGQPYILTTHFEDNASDPFCRVEIQKDGS